MVKPITISNVLFYRLFYSTAAKRRHDNKILNVSDNDRRLSSLSLYFRHRQGRSLHATSDRKTSANGIRDRPEPAHYVRAPVPGHLTRDIFVPVQLGQSGK